ncbi:hypothetical protein BJY01DRAFT_251300 [Aspergillus pseudoustus]|uniref:Uncharacterized protein n=1 Tax=Aspergillus pseudoustus TaxID=1810923 RepID=A0ABR4JCM9_9EURO
MSLIGGIRFAFGPWTLGTVNLCHWIHWAKAETEWTRPGSVAQLTITHYTQSVKAHKPSLQNLFLMDDYDFFSIGSKEATTLYNIGHRHSLLYFNEIRLGIAFFAIAFLTFSFTLGVCEIIPPTISGALILYPSLLLSCLENPYLWCWLLLIAMGVGWPFVMENSNQLAVLAVLSICPFLMAFSFLIIVTAAGVKGLQLFPDEKFLVNALAGQAEYTGYSLKPARIWEAAMQSFNGHGRGAKVQHPV